MYQSSYNMSLHEASMSSGLEAGKHFAGWKLGTSFKDMRFWVLQGKVLFFSLDLHVVSFMLPYYFTGTCLG